MRAVLFCQPKTVKRWVFSVFLFLVPLLLAIPLHQMIGMVPDPLEHTDLSPLEGRCIVIDAGHGGIDDGAKWNGVVEKHVNLQIAKQLQAILEENAVRVIMIRDGDQDFYTRGKGGKRNDLLKRQEMIENSAADLFVSIHLNAIRGANWRGAQVFYNPIHPQNKPLAEALQRVLSVYPPGNKRRIQQDLDIIVLNASSVPGVLIEAGFVSNPQEAALLSDPTYQKRLAEAIAKALAYHIRQNAGR